jgi:hypothetical protein
LAAPTRAQTPDHFPPPWLIPGGGFLYEAGALVSKARLRALRVGIARPLLSCAYRGIGWRGRPWCLLLAALSARVVYAKIVLGMLIQILGGNPIAPGRGLACKRDIALEDLMRGAPDSYVRAVAVEGLAALWRSMLLRKWPVAVVAPALTLV